MSIYTEEDKKIMANLLKKFPFLDEDNFIGMVSMSGVCSDKKILSSIYGICKKIYEHPTDEEYIITCGKILYKMGGEDTGLMMLVAHILLFFYRMTPFNNTVWGQAGNIEYLWTKVTPKWQM